MAPDPDSSRLGPSDTQGMSGEPANVRPLTESELEALYCVREGLNIAGAYPLDPVALHATRDLLDKALRHLGHEADRA